MRVVLRCLLKQDDTTSSCYSTSVSYRECSQSCKMQKQLKKQSSTWLLFYSGLNKELLVIMLCNAMCKFRVFFYQRTRAKTGCSIQFCHFTRCKRPHKHSHENLLCFCRWKLKNRDGTLVQDSVLYNPWSIQCSCPCGVLHVHLWEVPGRTLDTENHPWV